MRVCVCVWGGGRGVEGGMDNKRLSVQQLCKDRERGGGRGREREGEGDTEIKRGKYTMEKNTQSVDVT